MPDRPSPSQDSDDDDAGLDLLPETDPDQTDAERYSTDEGRTEEDLKP